MKRIPVILAVVAILLLPAASALAEVFDFSFTGPLFSGSGTFTAVSQGGGEYLITGVTGTTDGSSIVGLLAPGTYPTGLFQSPNDNVLIYPPEVPWDGIDEYFDRDGVSFALASGADVNLNDTLTIENAVLGGRDLTEADDITITDPPPVPEPNTLALLGVGMFAFAGAIRRRYCA